MSDELDQDKYVDEAVPMKKLPAGDPRGPTAVSPRAQATVPQDPLPFEDDTAAEPEPGGEPASSRLTRPVKIGLIVGASILALIASALVYVTVRFDAILRDSIRAQAKERGLDMKFEGVESTGILPWQSGEPRVTLSGVTLTSEEAPHVEISLDRVVVPLKGGFPSYEPDLVEVTGGSLTAPDLPSIIALERSARSGKASKTTAVLRDTEVRIARISEKAPFTVIGRASRIDVGDGRVDLEGVTLEVPVPFGDFTVGPIGAEIERTADFTWARFDSMKSARFGVSDDAMLGKLQADPVDSQGIGKELGLDLPPMKISGTVDAQLNGSEALSGTFDILLDGYVPPHPKELSGILHEKKTRLTGKMKAEGDALVFDDLVVTSGGLKLKGKGKLEWTGGGTLTLSLGGSVGCAQLATSVLSSRLGPLAGALGGSVANGHLSGTVGVKIDVATKLKDIKNLSVSPRVSINCGIGL